MKTIIILLSLAWSLTSCTNDGYTYISFYNIGKKPIDIKYSFDLREYSTRIEPNTNTTYTFRKDCSDAYKYRSIESIEPYDYSFIINISINNKIIVPKFQSGSTLSWSLYEQCYNFIIDDNAIYRFSIDPMTSWAQDHSYERGSMIDTANYWVMDFIQNNKKNYSSNSRKKGCYIIDENANYHFEPETKTNWLDHYFNWRDHGMLSDLDEIEFVNDWVMDFIQNNKKNYSGNSRKSSWIDEYCNRRDHGITPVPEEILMEVIKVKYPGYKRKKYSWKRLVELTLEKIGDISTSQQ